MNNYNDKYLKYKTKYINLRNKIGGTKCELVNKSKFTTLSSGNRCIAINSSGYIAITYMHGVNIYDRNWDLIAHIGDSTPGTSNNKFHNPVGIVFDNDDNMLIVDKNNNRIQVYDKSYNYTRTIDDGSGRSSSLLLTFPTAICISKDGDIVVLNNGGIIRVFSNTGDLKRTIDENCNGDIKFDSTGDLVVFHSGGLGDYALKYKNHIKVIDYNHGIVLRSFPIPIPIPIQGDSVLINFVLDSKGHIILSNYYDGSIYILDYNSGTPKCTITAGITGLINPYGIGIDDKENIFICDNDNIKVFSLSVTL
jgi:hypothetical protein